MKQFYQKIQLGNGKSYLTFFGLLLIGFAFIFFITQGLNPNTSELSFIEHSTAGKDAGSVIPASCESGYAHVEGTCIPTIDLQFQ